MKIDQKNTTKVGKFEVFTTRNPSQIVSTSHLVSQYPQTPFVWSSYDCKTTRAPDVRTLILGNVRVYRRKLQLSWVKINVHEWLCRLTPVDTTGENLTGILRIGMIVVCLVRRVPPSPRLKRLKFYRTGVSAILQPRHYCSRHDSVFHTFRGHHDDTTNVHTMSNYIYSGLAT